MAADAVTGIGAMRALLAPLRHRDKTIGLVPTMGALHAGHARLIERARIDCDCVVVSIFVNPLQFDRKDDLDRYPRALDADLALCTSRGVDFAFAPTAAEMYPKAPVCTVDPGRVAEHCCGRYRPRHFTGVATVVLKLLDIVQPDVAYFGEKDAQQLAVIRRLVSDFNVPVTVIGVPTVREADGLALSSRNRHLSPAERRLAPSLYDALTDAASHVAAGMTDAEDVKRHAATRIPTDERVRLEYLEVVDPDDFQPVERITEPVVIAGAMWVGGTRLIDNVRSSPRTTS
jgi:pantoate--beta-alanine ligase